MKKFGLLFVTTMMVVLCYILMMLFQPSINTMIASTNSTVNWTQHSNFALAQAAMVGWPFWAYFIPASIGLIAWVAILRGD